VRMVAVTGSLAMKNPEAKSDLDLLVVLKGGHIFTGRLLATALVHLLGQRRYAGKIKDRICLNYFLSDSALEISLKDIFAASEYFFILPIYGLKTFRHFRKTNQWIEKYKPNYSVEMISGPKIVTDNLWLKFIRNTGEKILGFPRLEKYFKKIQLEKIAKNPKTRLPGGIILADDGQLVFLPIPQSPQIFEKFKTRLESLRA